MKKYCTDSPTMVGNEKIQTPGLIIRMHSLKMLRKMQTGKWRDEEETL
jgi:hypothetical protein